jgi:hypothetical protein
MKIRSLFLTCAAGILAYVGSPTLSADTWDQKTVMTFSGSVELPGKVLPAGSYIFKLADAPGVRNVVQVWNSEQTQLIGTFLTITSERLHAAGKPILKFAERPAGQPEALKAWFFPGSSIGDEFVYPHDEAAALAKANKQPVLATRGEPNGKSADIEYVGPNGEEVNQKDVGSR